MQREDSNKKEGESEGKIEFRVIMDLNQKMVELEGNPGDLSRLFFLETDCLRTYELLRSHVERPMPFDQLNIQ